MSKAYGILSALVALAFTQLSIHCTGFVSGTPIVSRADSGGADVVDTGYARYLGNRSFPNTVAYLGLPYAEPPLGERRFRAPIALNTTRVQSEANGEVVDATRYPDFCVQGPIGGTDMGGAGSEDCLKINVYAPVGANRSSNLPVLVYIHGGGYVFGNPANWPFDHWIHQSPNVVVASVYYRLDSFGFLSHPDFFDGDLADNNVGFLDQVEALKWVKRNIAAFGGNPEKVTINGQSAGGGSVLFHIVAKEEPGLFSGAIAQSVARSATPQADQKKPLFELYSDAAGCGTGSLADRMACLRNASISTLARAQEMARTFNISYHGFGPIVDEKVITEHPTRSIIKGDYANVPLIVGATSNETGGGGTDLGAALKASYPLLNDQDIAEFEEVYSLSDFMSQADRVGTATGESGLRCARESLGSLFLRNNKAWTYRYNQPNPTQSGTAVQHAAENWMMFLGINTGTNGTGQFTPMTDVENAFASELIAYWLSFVRSGDPNTFKLNRSPMWVDYTGEEQRIVLQQDPQNSTTTSGIFMEAEPAKERDRCAFVQSKSDKEQN
ncbi:alpha/beta-hydrolase [Dendrothele bispora CBS 962.96]|uniref:Carboxylic ester hydrolase n=1 Tax=Dendrothele bispora (strain CBS 962.96) TaxID=1314807 RepID=A0A4S8L1B0_DENBC|nr:alpha/beta-hydrolase [Dendrothele bispora CBS 962.96]